MFWTNYALSAHSSARIALRGSGARYESRNKARKQACDIAYILLQRLNTQQLVHDIAKVDIS